MAGALRSEKDKLVLVRQIDHRFHMYGAVGITVLINNCVHSDHRL